MTTILRTAVRKDGDSDMPYKPGVAGGPPGRGDHETVLNSGVT